MRPENLPINYYTAVLQALLSDTGRFFSVSDIQSHIAENHPLATTPSTRRSIHRALSQLAQVPLIEQTSERRYIRCIPVSVYRYKI